MFQTIKNYDEIDILPNSIVMMDIDNTIIKFEKLYKNWWKDNEPNALEGWLKIIKEEDPKMLDEIEFTILLNKIKNTNSEIIYITARDEELRELTYKQLIDCGIKVSTNQIYHSYPKGNKMIEIYKEKSKTKEIQNIIFIDDHSYNIEDAQLNLSKYLEYSNIQIKYYLMNHKNLNDT
jgi:hypothetical protein